MLLSEALADRKQALQDVASLEAQVTSAAVEYEDSPSDEDPAALMQDLARAAERFAQLSVNINRTNNQTEIEFNGQTMTLMEAIANRERLLLEHRAGKRIAEAVDEKVFGRSRYGARRTKEDIKQVDKIGLKELRARNDRIAADIRRLDGQIQRANWTVEAVE